MSLNSRFLAVFSLDCQIPPMPFSPPPPPPFFILPVLSFIPLSSFDRRRTNGREFVMGSPARQQRKKREIPIPLSLSLHEIRSPSPLFISAKKSS